jgi:hypothetical protein
MDHIIREVIEIELHPNNMSREVGFCLSKSWKPLICSLKKPEHDTRSTKLLAYEAEYTISNPIATGSILAQ